MARDALYSSTAGHPGQHFLAECAGKVKWRIGVRVLSAEQSWTIPASAVAGYIVLISLDEPCGFTVHDRGDPAPRVHPHPQRLVVRDAGRSWVATGRGAAGRILALQFAEQLRRHPARIGMPSSESGGDDTDPLASMRHIGQAMLGLLGTRHLSERGPLGLLVGAFIAQLGLTPSAFDELHRKEGLANWQVRRATQLMLSRIADRVSLAEIAGSCGLSPNYFSRLFKRSMGTSTYQWLLEQRIDRSQMLLATTDDSLSDIACACGFADQAHFTRAFSRRAGTTPLVWRRRRRHDTVDVAQAGALASTT